MSIAREPAGDSPSPVAPDVSFDAFRDIPLPDSVQRQEEDVYIARHNSIIMALGPRVDRVLGDAEFALAKLSKGLAFEAVRHFKYPFAFYLTRTKSFCDAISGQMAIRGVSPDLPSWRETVQYEANVAQGDALTSIITKAREDLRLVGVDGVDVTLDDGTRREESCVWTKRCGEKVGTAAEWWAPDNDGEVLDGSIAQAGQAAHLYLSMEEFKAAGGAGRPSEAFACLDILRLLLGQTESIRSVTENARDLLSAQVLEQERRVVAIYSYLYPEQAQALGIPSDESLTEVIEDLAPIFAGHAQSS